MASERGTTNTISPLFAASGSQRAPFEVEDSRRATPASGSKWNLVPIVEHAVENAVAPKSKQWYCGAVTIAMVYIFLLGSMVAVLDKQATVDGLCARHDVVCASGWEFDVRYELCVPKVPCNASHLLVQGVGCQRVYPCGGANASLSPACTHEFECLTAAWRQWTPRYPCMTINKCVNNTQLWSGSQCIDALGSCQQIYQFLPKLYILLSVALGLPALVFLAEFLASLRPGKVRNRKVSLFQWLMKHSGYEGFQLLVSLMGCASYLYYVDVVYVVPYEDKGGLRYVYEYYGGVEQSFVFLEMELFVVTSYMIDYMLRLATMPTERVFKYVFSFYSLVDLVAFCSVVYPPFFEEAVEKATPHSIYMAVGLLRFLRVRRAMQSLDHVRAGQDVKFGPLHITARTGAIAVAVVNILMYIFMSAALVMFCEFPCFVIDRVDQLCNDDFQAFYNVVYFIVVTYATVGYGDMTPVTPLGRVVVSLLIVIMLIFVPVQINALAGFFADDDTDKGPSQLDEIQSMVATLDSDMRRQFNMPPPPRMSIVLADPASADPAVIKQWLIGRLMRNVGPDLLARIADSADIPFKTMDEAADRLIHKLIMRESHHPSHIGPPTS